MADKTRSADHIDYLDNVAEAFQREGATFDALQMNNAAVQWREERRQIHQLTVENSALQQRLNAIVKVAA